MCWTSFRTIFSLSAFCLCLSIVQASNYQHQITNSDGWKAVISTPINATAHAAFLRQLLRLGDSQYVQIHSGLPVLASFTTISTRIDKAYYTVFSLLWGEIVPHHVFLFISDQFYLLDKGVENIPEQLLCLTAAGYLSIINTQNIGPHRKLLPLLRRYYHEKVLILTVDDDLLPSPASSTLLLHLLHVFHHTNGTSIPALRARRIGMCIGRDIGQKGLIARYRHWSLCRVRYTPQMLTLPTGTGGVLYQPKQLHPVVFDEHLRQLTGTADDLMFRLAALAQGVSVMVGCSDSDAHPCPVPAPPVPTVTMPLKSLPNYRFSLNPTINGWVSNATFSSSESLPWDGTLKRNASSLFFINFMKQNDISWRQSVQYLESIGVLNWQSILNKYYYEREQSCYHKSARNRKATMRLCAIWPCEKETTFVLNMTDRNTPLK